MSVLKWDESALISLTRRHPRWVAEMGLYCKRLLEVKEVPPL